jgi:hypothetical protein
MTINCNYPRVLPQIPNQQADAEVLRGMRLLKRRWTLLQHFHNLPDRGWEASERYFNWLHHEWHCVQDNAAIAHETTEQARHSVDIRNLNWLAFSLGGADAYVRANDFAPDSVTTFAACTRYVHNYSCSAADIRSLHYLLNDLTTLIPQAFSAERAAGERNAAYWIEQHHNRALAKTLHKPPLSRIDQPPCFGDLIELQLAQECGAIQ